LTKTTQIERIGENHTGNPSDLTPPAGTTEAADGAEMINCIILGRERSSPIKN